MNENIKEEITKMEKSQEIKTIDENYENLKAVITSLTQDYEKFKEKKVKAAGQRVRNGLLNTKKLCDELRKQVKAEIVAIPVKHRKTTDDSDDSEDQKIGETITTITKEDDGVYETSITLTDIKEEDKPEEKPKRKRKANKK